MKTITWMVLGVCIATQLGFEWGSASKKKQKASPAPVYAQAVVPKSNEPVSFSQMMTALSQDLVSWPRLSAENKNQAVEAAKLFFQDSFNSAILRPADFYVAQIDEVLIANQSLQQVDLMSVLKMMAVAEYDFYNGQNKDELAKEILGDEIYQSLNSQK